MKMISHSISSLHQILFPPHDYTIPSVMMLSDVSELVKTSCDATVSLQPPPVRASQSAKPVFLPAWASALRTNPLSLPARFNASITDYTAGSNGLCRRQENEAGFFFHLIRSQKASSREPGLLILAPLLPKAHEEVFLGNKGLNDVENYELPRLVYVLVRRVPSIQLKIRLSGVLSNKCGYYINNTKALRSAICFPKNP
ncbi:hypothetical protein HID58_036603 [Brassica napus]|uniref:Uncharacterized protein n=1 Tax=Brassica napus TaxID=3708 RepID=A0ABQ8C936_BRANA|nr:hypothetical protein HID58_036603 [Brassica napus]